METTDHGPLAISDLTALEVIAQAAEGRKVARAVESGDIVYGTGRCLGDENGCQAWGHDVRDMFLRVTTREGWEVFWPVRELMPEALEGTFAIYDW